MKKLTTLKINGEGWNGLVAQFRNGENIDLLRLVEIYPEKYPYFLESSYSDLSEKNSMVNFHISGFQTSPTFFFCHGFVQNPLLDNFGSEI